MNREAPPNPPTDEEMEEQELDIDTEPPTEEEIRKERRCRLSRMGRHQAGAPNDGFLPNALKRCFRLSGVLLKLCRLILGCAIKCLSVRSF